MTKHFVMNTLSEENYLKGIYSLSRKVQEKITVTAIAAELSINAASVIEMLKKLVEKKLITYDKSKGAKLSEKGRKAALLIIRKHRLWEVFLQKKLGYSWDVVHEIAEQLEHVSHDELADRLEKYLGFPEFDPHGDPIPNASGEIPSMTKTVLSEIDEGKSCQIIAIKDTTTLFLQYLEQLQLKIGSKIKVLKKIPYDQSLSIQIGKGPITAVSHKVAENILVV